MSDDVIEIHPEARAAIARILASGEPPMETLAPAEARRLADARVAANGVPAPEMAEVRNFNVPGPAGNIPVRLYRPTARTNAPFVIFFHGGGFMLAGLHTHDSLCRFIAERAGAALLAVDYRLAPENKFPAAPEDCLAATRWALANPAALGVEPGRFALIGESSGGNLTAVVAQALAKDGGPQPKLQVMIYPGLDMSTDHPSYKRLGEGFFFTEKKARYFIDHYLARPEDADDPRASPVRATDLEGVAPAMIITAGLDPLVDEAEIYADKLRAAGVAVTYRCFEGWPHGFLFWGHTEASKQALAMAADGLRDALAG